MMNEKGFDRYLGDGVYVSYDGFHVWLDLRAQDDTTKIALEPEVAEALIQYLNAVKAYRTQGVVGDGKGDRFDCSSGDSIKKYP